MNDAELRPLTPEGLVPALNPTLVTNGEGLLKVKNYLQRIADQATAGMPTASFAKDYETNIAEVFTDRRARTLQIGDKNEQYIIDFLHFAQSTEALIAGQGDGKTSSWAQPIVDVVGPAFDSNAFLKIGQNLAFEYELSAWNFGMRFWNLYSVDIAERVVWAGLHTFKDLKFYSLANMAARHFNVLVDKTNQTTFDLSSELTEDQIVYAAFDLRLPIAIRAKQLPILERDGLARVTHIENDAIPFFSDLHLNGIRTNTEMWSGLISEWTTKYRHEIEQLDTFFMPIVGPKNITEEGLDSILTEWKDLTLDSDAEKALKELLKATKDKAAKEPIRAQIVQTVKERKERAAEARKRYTTLRSKITANRKIAAKCEGEAALNYGSQTQLKKALLQLKGFSKTSLPSTDDSVLSKHKHPVVTHLREYRTFAKLLETYGQSWVSTYQTEPNNEQGWINPHTGKIHSRINQLEAETGRTSSVKPNIQNLPHDDRVRACFVVDPPDAEEPDGYVMVTVDMSGAELRIIAEESGAVVWVDAFNNGWDVHSVGTELLYPVEWPEAQLPECAYFLKDHKKCKCPRHMELRDGNKATNFLLAYGGGPAALAEAINSSRIETWNQGGCVGPMPVLMTEAEASALMAKHEGANPEVWAYLERSGKQAVADLQSRSKCGRRRLFKKPNWDDAVEIARLRLFEKLKKTGAHEREQLDGRIEKIKLEDCHPENYLIRSALRGMSGSIERRGKNHRIQSLNATIAKLAFGAGSDKDGKPYLWHEMPKFKAKAVNFVHDEIVAQVPKRFGEEFKLAVYDAIKRAGAEFLEKVTMEAEGRISHRWQK